MASGITVSKDANDTFFAMKEKKGTLLAVLGFAIVPIKEGASMEERLSMKLDNKIPNEVVPDEGASIKLRDDFEHQEFIDMVKEKFPNQGRYFVLDFLTKANKETGHRKLIFCSWIPDDMVTKPKMLYASTKDAVKNAFKITQHVQANELSDLEAGSFEDKLK